jgi:methionyl-tRNA formyltransferase
VLIADSRDLVVATGSGAVRVLRLQRPGGRPMDAASFLRGYPLRAGDLLHGAQ